ncbi:MAG: ATP-binding cassette domain-containing protein [bacterium]|nr:ATP-binding cassette domain-containing protein [bacterium]
MTAVTCAVHLDGVCKSFGDRPAVCDLSLKIWPGAIYGFLGPNGAGKTTTMRLILGIYLPDSGSVSVLGLDDPRLVRERIGYLPEERGLYPRMRVLDQVAYFGALKGLSDLESRSRAGDLLDKYGLGSCSQMRCQALSKGMAQKVQILATLIHEPDLVILDEPFSGLDPVNRDLMRDVIVGLRDRGASVIFSTHITEQAEQICDHVVLIDGGRKLLDGATQQVRAAAGGAVHLEYEGDISMLAGLPDVQRVNDGGRQAEIILAEGGDPQVVLRSLVEHAVTVLAFDLRQPSLHEVFIRSVSRPAAEVSLE